MLQKKQVLKKKNVKIAKCVNLSLPYLVDDSVVFSKSPADLMKGFDEGERMGQSAERAIFQKNANQMVQSKEGPYLKRTRTKNLLWHKEKRIWAR